MLNPHYKIKPITDVTFRFVPIKTKGKPWLKKVWAWRTQSRRIILAENWYMKGPDDKDTMFPKGFDSDGSSLPRILRFIDDPMGISLTAGLGHDFLYRFRCILNPDGSIRQKDMTRFQCDDWMKRVNIHTNDMLLLGVMMNLVLRLTGWFAWKQHRKNDNSYRNNVNQYLEKVDGEP